MQTRTASGSLQRKTYENEVEVDDYNQFEAEDMPLPRPRKKVKTHATDDSKPEKVAQVPKQNGKGKGKAATQIYRGRNVGKLAKLLEMPMDIFCEISKHLGPLDLLQLSRATKGFNQILMSRDSKPIWRAARATHPNLPDCPPDISEPEYARLLFLKECHVCLVGRVMKVDYDLRTRLCRRCRASHVQSGDMLLRMVPGLTEGLLECISSDHIEPWFIGRPCTLKSYYKPAAERIVSRYNKAVPLTLSKEEAQKAKTEFIESRKTMMAQIPQNVRQLSEWASSQVNAKQMSDSEAIKRRKEAIHVKLFELGYTPQDIPSVHAKYTEWYMEWNRILQQPRDLTPRIWTNIRPKLENHIASYKIFREERERSNRQNHRRVELRGHLHTLLTELAADNSKFYYPVERAFTLPTCVTVMKENDFSNPITEEKWTEIKDQVLSEVHAVVEEAENHLISTITSLDPKQIPKSLTIPEEMNKEFIFASTTYFSCNQCKYGARYPQLRRHSCVGGSLTATGQDEARFAFDPLRTAVAQALLESLPEIDDEDDIATKFVKCNICLIRLQWSHLIRHFYPEDMKHTCSQYFHYHTVATNSHNLEEAFQKVDGRPLITVQDEEDGNEYGGYEDSEEEDDYYGGYDVYGYDDYGYGGQSDSDMDEYGFYDDPDYEHCIIT